MLRSRKTRREKSPDWVPSFCTPAQAAALRRWARVTIDTFGQEFGPDIVLNQVEKMRPPNRGRQ